MAPRYFKTRHTLYIVRHGVATHNIPMVGPTGQHIRPDLSDIRFFDAPLVAQGIRESHDLGKYLQTYLGDNVIDEVISSPLTRCLQTAKEISKEIGIVSKWRVREELREAFGVHYSDKRRSKGMLETEWPNVHFEISENDECWKPKSRESIQDVEQRIDHFLFWLSMHQRQSSYSEESQPKIFLVLTHGVWMECFFRKYYASILDGGKRVYNSDLFEVSVVGIWYGSNDDLTYQRSQIEKAKCLYSAHGR